MIVIGYSGHAYVVCGILFAAGKKVTGYCDFEEKLQNPFQLAYYGNENSEKAIGALQGSGFFISQSFHAYILQPTPKPRKRLC